MKTLTRSIAAVIAMTALTASAQFTTATTGFDSDLGEFAGEDNAEWISDRGNTAPGCLRIHSPDENQVAVSLNIWTGNGFPTEPVNLGFWMLDSSGGAGHAVNIQMDFATTGANGTCGWFNYVGQIGVSAGGWSGDWEEGYSMTFPELGAAPSQWGTDIRTDWIEWIEGNACMAENFTGTAADTAAKPILLVWRFRVTNGTLLIDDFTQELGTVDIQVEKTGPAAIASPVNIMANSVTFGEKTRYAVSVHSADGRVVASTSGTGASAAIPTGNLASGSYLVRVNSALGNSVGTIAVQ